MNRLEQLMGVNDNRINFIFDNMPKGLGGLTVGNEIRLSINQTYPEMVNQIGEEIGHYETTVGDITDQRILSNRRQELQARKRGYVMIVDLDGLIACYRADITTPWEMAEFFECTVKYIWKAIDTYRITRGCVFDYKGYRFNLYHGFDMKKI